MNNDPTRSPSGHTVLALTERERRSHEVRTHLTVISLRAQLLRRRLHGQACDAPELVGSLDAIDGAVAKLRREVERWDDADAVDAAGAG